MDDLAYLIRQYEIEKDLCDSAPTMDALLYWWTKWTGTAMQIYKLISRKELVGACHVNEGWTGHPADGD